MAWGDGPETAPLCKPILKEMTPERRRELRDQGFELSYIKTGQRSIAHFPNVKNTLRNCQELGGGNAWHITVFIIILFC